MSQTKVNKIQTGTPAGNQCELKVKLSYPGKSTLAIVTSRSDANWTVTYQGMQMCVFRYVNVAILIWVGLLLVLTSCAKSDEMKLIATISSSPQYIGFDNTNGNLICAYPKENKDGLEQDKYLLKEYDIHSGAEIHDNFALEAVWPKLFNRIWFDSQYYLDDHTYSGGSLVVQNRLNDDLNGNKSEQIYWNSNNEFPHGIDFIFQIDRIDSRFPFLAFWSRKALIIFDLEKKEIIKAIPRKETPKEAYLKVYLPETLDRIVCKKWSLYDTPSVPALVFFASEENFKDGDAQFIWASANDATGYDAIGFLNSNIFAFSTSTFGRYTFTGEKRLYLYDFSTNRIIVDLRLTPLVAFNSCAFGLNNIAISGSGKYLAILYDKKISIYEL